MLGLGSWEEGGIAMMREVAEQRWRQAVRKGRVTSNILGCKVLNVIIPQSKEDVGSLKLQC